jgi:hypothetical protein
MYGGRITNPNGESVDFLLLAGDLVRALARFCRAGAFTFRLVFVIIIKIVRYRHTISRRNRRFGCSVLSCSRTLVPQIG